jgi:uncharacterized protein (DUF362 family)/ferredoxin
VAYLLSGESLEAPFTVFLKVDLGDPILGREHGHTDPSVLAAVADCFRRMGATVIVGDSPFADGTSVRRRWAELGLPRLAATVGFELADLEASGVRAKVVKDTVYYIARPVLEADLVVNLPCLRPHARFGFNGALTSILGVLPGFQKMRHSVRAADDAAWGRVLADLYSQVMPALTILDLGVEGDADTRTVILSTDGIAVDALVADRLGLDPAQLPHIREAAEAGLGIGWAEAVRVEEDEARPVLLTGHLGPKQRSPWVRQWVARWAEEWIWSRPKIDGSRCDSCGECVKCCPTKALRAEGGGGVPTVTAQMCIACWRCSTICPTGAVVPYQSPLTRLLLEPKRRTCVF